jgi:DDE_Tnp_1-associated
MKAAELGPSLLAAFARVPDVRSRHGRRSPLPALLTLATAAMLCRARSPYAMAQWGRLQPKAVRQALGFRGPRMPGITTLHYVFKRLQVDFFERELQAWAAQVLDPTTQQLVLAGNALRGLHGEELPGVRLVALYAPDAGLALAQAGGQDQRGPGADWRGSRADQA